MSRRKLYWKRRVIQAIRSGHSDFERLVPKKAGEKTVALIAATWKQLKGGA